jgi:hypothetical protein
MKRLPKDAKYNVNTTVCGIKSEWMYWLGSDNTSTQKDSSLLASV